MSNSFFIVGCIRLSKNEFRTEDENIELFLNKLEFFKQNVNYEIDLSDSFLSSPESVRDSINSLHEICKKLNAVETCALAYIQKYMTGIDIFFGETQITIQNLSVINQLEHLNGQQIVARTLELQVSKPMFDLVSDNETINSFFI
ncbi:hypothetical protein HWA77_16945 [Photobacterium damselae subsp. damselae]|uniref:Uncharacterized protein n=1 Tax=Photobacterium damselae subsp. damselae TaxID=85581 RepID=A0A850QVN4_PHODD|nr:hypothetical protein [Photobacterium damselae subsp. damselae]